MAEAMHRPHGHEMRDRCPGCEENAKDPTALLDDELLADVVGLASVRGDRFAVAKTEVELIAAKHCLDALERVGRMLEVNAPAVRRYFSEAWRIDV